MEQQQKHRLGPVQSLLPQLSQLKSQQEQKGDFDHLRRLQIESAPGQGDPALVPGSVVIAQGDQQEQKPHIDHRQQPPQLLQQLSHIQHGQKQAQDNPSPQRHSLLSHQAMGGFPHTGVALKISARPYSAALRQRKNSGHSRFFRPTAHASLPILPGLVPQRVISPFIIP